jgi:hypothetical protein
VNNVDSVPVKAPFVEHRLLFKRGYKFSRASLAVINHPIFFLEGTYAGLKPYILRISLDGKYVSSYLLDNSGDFSWKIPVPVHAEKNSPAFVKMEFTAEPVNTVTSGTAVTPTITIEKMFLNGYLDVATTLPVDTTISYCHQYSTTTVCTVPPARVGKLVELPSFYYPTLLSLTLNGKRITPTSVLYKDSLIAAVRVPPNQVNIIKVKFSGLSWANRVSAAGWCGWLVLVVVMLGQKINRRTFKLTY